MAPEQRRLLPLLAAAAAACSLLSACAAAAAASTGTLALRHHKPARQHNSTRHGGGGRSRAGGGSPGTGMASCNLFQGSWVYDDTLPMYDTAGCPFVEAEFDCQKYGRPDKAYLKYRWRPASCELPRFDGQDFLSRWKGKKILFVGDSLSLNQWESLACMLHAAAPASKVAYSRGNPVSTITFQSADAIFLGSVHRRRRQTPRSKEVHLPCRQGTPRMVKPQDPAPGTSKHIDFVERKSAITLAIWKRNRRSAIASRRTGDRKKSPPSLENPATRTSSPKGTRKSPTLPQNNRRILTKQPAKQNSPDTPWRNKSFTATAPAAAASRRRTSSRCRSSVVFINHQESKMPTPNAWPAEEPPLIRRRKVADPATLPGPYSSAIVPDGEQTLGVDIEKTTLYTPARRFPGSPSSPAPDRPPEREGAGGIAAGNSARLLVALFALSRL